MGQGLAASVVMYVCMYVCISVTLLECFFVKSFIFLVKIARLGLARVRFRNVCHVALADENVAQEDGRT